MGSDVLKRSRWKHGFFVASVLVPTAGGGVLFVWLGATVSPLCWSGLGLPMLYAAGPALYHFESKYPGSWLSEALAVLGERYPPILWWVRYKEAGAANEALVKDFNLTLREYRLDQLSEKGSGELVARGRKVSIAHVAKYASKHVRGAPSRDALELLHRERSGWPTRSLWLTKKESVLAEIAPILHRSRRIPDPDAVYPYTKNDVRELLGELREFDVDVVAQELRILRDLNKRLESYADFLDQQGLSTQPPKPAGLPTAIRNEAGLPSGPSTLSKLESPVAMLRLMDRVNGFKEGDAFGAVHRGIFLAEYDVRAGPLKEHCWLVSHWDKRATPDPVLILHAYLWEKDRRGVKEAPVTLAELDKQWSAWSAHAERSLKEARKDLRNELKSLGTQIDAGDWPVRRVDFDGNVIFSTDVQPALSRHDEVRDLDAYLIAFDERSGPVAKLIDSLKTQQPRGSNTYRFGPYTRFTRLGLLPPNMPFHEFIDRLFADLDSALRRYAPGPPLDIPANGVLRVPASHPSNIRLRHDGTCRGEVDFEITRNPDEGWLGEPWKSDSEPVLVTYFPPPGLLARRKWAEFEYASRCGRAKETHLVELLVEPTESVPRVSAGQQYNIRLRHDGHCRGDVDFEITTPPGLGRLGEKSRIDPQHALVTYFAPPALDRARKVDFEYESRCGTTTKTHRVELLVEPKGQEQRLDRIEVTVNRVDLAHCRELWFGDQALGPVLRPPSIYDVWKAIEGHLGADESPKVKEAFERIAGGHGVPRRPSARRQALRRNGG
jgi:hypothetical protein